MKADSARPAPHEAAAGIHDSRRYRIEAIARAAHTLTCLADGGETTPAAIAARAQAPEAFVTSALAALERRGLARARADSPGAWALGLGWLRLAAAGRRQVDLRDIAQPIMRRMRDDVDETVILAIRRGKRRVSIEYVESTQDVRRMTQVGDEAALYLGSAGRILLMGLEPRDLRDYLNSVATTDGKIIMGLDVDGYIAEIEATRRRGYARTMREATADLCAISTAVRDHTGQIVASLTISCPADRFNDALERACARAAMAGALEVSRLIGYSSEGGKA